VCVQDCEVPHAPFSTGFFLRELLAKNHEKFPKKRALTRGIDWCNFYRSNSSHSEVIIKKHFFSRSIGKQISIVVSNPLIFSIATRMIDKSCTNRFLLSKRVFWFIFQDFLLIIPSEKAPLRKGHEVPPNLVGVL
jgi:hypothetical protein